MAVGRSVMQVSLSVILVWGIAGAVCVAVYAVVYMANAIRPNNYHNPQVACFS